MNKKLWFWTLLTIVLAAVLTACAATSSATTPDTPTTLPAETTAPTVESEMTPEAPTLMPTETVKPALEDTPPTGAQLEFSTDFSQHSIPYDEILSGGPPKDGISAIDTPAFTSVDEADAWLKPREPVIHVQLGDEVRAYPIQILTWHEIVNDVMNDTPISVTFCPLCNTAIAFEARMDGRDLNFGTTGRLRYSNMVMYDRQTESWWQQATGEAIAGEFTGRRLTTLPATLVAWEDFKTAHPEALVLSRETGSARDYGRNPYTGYDDLDNRPFLYDGPETPGTLPAMARVYTIERGDEAVTYPYDVMATQHVANDTVGGTPIAVFWVPGTASALDRASIGDSRDVGTVAAFSRVLDGRTLTFAYDGESIIDEETGSAWDIFGRAIDGPQAGAQLNPIVGINHFWFSWAAFRPETRIYQPEQTTSSDEITQEEWEALAGNLPSDVAITLYDGAGVFDGETVLLSQILAQGKPVVVHFWAGLCPICRREMPDIQATHVAYQDRVTLVGIDIGAFTGLGDEAAARAMMDEFGTTFPNGTIPNAAALQAYEVLGVPASLFFTPNGELVDQWNGLLTEAQLHERIDTLIAVSDS